ncbi:Protein of unknown function [Pyronema omphalodes CBS 100304]|uniref:Uncharacterized protein n=1 Tax=Pyronema omphalodes (strain CBS 100304) TaxID=1076935 RepID=U4LDU5_PYROM|nr:Protein of unknown function [Pyronema omphalodes CBS 100304]
MSLTYVTIRGRLRLHQHPPTGVDIRRTLHAFLWVYVPVEFIASPFEINHLCSSL